jgi:hypothetical protein
MSPPSPAWTSGLPTPADSSEPTVSAAAVVLKGLEGPWYSATRRRAAKAWLANRAEIAQLVEHATENRGVASSILALGTTNSVVANIERKWLSW